MRGFVSTLTYILAPLAGMMVACRFRSGLMKAFDWTSTPVMDWFAWVILFASVSLIVCLVTSLVDSFLKKHHLGCWNHLLGLAFGFALTLVLTWLIAYGMMYFMDSARPMVAQSRSAKYLLQLAEAGKKTVPELPEAKTEPTKTVYQMPETFIQRVQEGKDKNPEDVKPDGNSGIPRFLDDVDAKLEPIFIPEADEKAP